MENGDSPVRPNGDVVYLSLEGKRALSISPSDDFLTLYGKNLISLIFVRSGM